MRNLGMGILSVFEGRAGGLGGLFCHVRGNIAGESYVMVRRSAFQWRTGALTQRIALLDAPVIVFLHTLMA